METLEPLIECVRQVMSTSGWTLTGLQKTTSYEYEGPWAGSAVRSAYAFFHRSDDTDGSSVSVEVFLDETDEGLEGNASLVLPGPSLSEEPRASVVVERAARTLEAAVPEGMSAPSVVSYHHPGTRPEASPRCTVRFKVRIPETAFRAGAQAVGATLRSVVATFETVLSTWNPAPRP